MKLLLVDNLLFEGGLATPRFDPQPHLGLMSLVAVARENGHQAEILNPRQLLCDGVLQLDAGLYAGLAEAIAAIDADAVGFTALGCNVHCVVQTAEALRALVPGRPILLGGPHATILHREMLLTFDCFDVVVRHEAEHSLPLILDAIEAGRSPADIPGITCRTEAGVVESPPGQIIEDLDALPIPDYGAYPLDRMNLDEIRVEAGRGCPFSCTFCSTATFFGRRYRLKSPERLLAEMDMLRQRYGFTRFKLNHDLFTVNRKSVLEFCEAVSGRGYEWSCSARMDCVDAPLLQAMARAGCRDIYFGVEAGSARMQEETRKRLDLALIGPTLAETARLSIRSTTSFIAGYPREEQADLDATLDAVGDTHLWEGRLNDAQLHLLTPEPGTELIAQHGGELKLDEHVSEFNFPRLAPGDADLLRKNPGIFPNHHHFQTKIARERLVFVTDLWPILCELERPALAWFVSVHGGRLSRLANDYFDWAHAAASTGPGLRSLADYLAARSGADAPAASVARFVAMRAELATAQTGRRKPMNSPEGTRLRLSNGLRLLPSCHDVPGLLSEPPAEARIGSLSDWLLLRGDGQIRLFAVGGDTMRLLQMFHQPMNYKAAVRMCVDQGRPVPAPGDVDALLKLGALELVAGAAAQDAA